MAANNMPADPSAVSFTTKAGKVMYGRLLDARGHQALVLTGSRFDERTNTWRGRAMWVVPFADLRQ